MKNLGWTIDSEQNKPNDKYLKIQAKSGNGKTMNSMIILQTYSLKEPHEMVSIRDWNQLKEMVKQFDNRHIE